MAKQQQFKVGDAVFYPSAGVGVVEAIEDLYLGGDVQKCLVVRIRQTQMTVKVPGANVEKCGIRHLLSNKEMKELCKVLASKSSRRITGGNWAERCKEMERKINSGSCVELGEVVRDLMRWKEQSGLSFEESMLLETASSYLANEWSMVRGVTHDDAIEQIRGYVGTQQANGSKISASA